MRHHPLIAPMCRILLVQVFVTCLTLSVGASSATALYGYNYGNDWREQGGLNYYEEANVAKSYQAAKGYTASAYSMFYAVEVYNNTAVVHAMQVSTHGWQEQDGDPNGGGVIMWGYSDPNRPTRTSCLLSTGQPYHSYPYYHWQTDENCNHWRSLSSLSSTPLKIVNYQACWGGEEYNASVPSVAQQAYLEGANWSQGPLLELGDEGSGTASAGYTFSYWFWRMLRYNYYSNYALTVAIEKTSDQWGSDTNYWSYTAWGNLNEQL